MSTKITSWGRHALRLGLIAMIAALAERTAAYEYVETVDPWEATSAPHYYRDATRWEEAFGSADADESGYVTCTTDTWARASDDTADASAWALGQVIFEWEWNGPPGTAPGGELSWYHAGDGYAQVTGDLDLVTGDTAQSTSDAESGTAVGTPGDSSSASGRAYGQVQAGSGGQGDAYASGSPTPYAIYTTKDPRSDGYYYSVEWNAFYEPDDPEDIPSGTSYFYVNGEVACTCESYATSSTAQGGYADSEVTANASLFAYVAFDSN